MVFNPGLHRRKGKLPLFTAQPFLSLYYGLIVFEPLVLSWWCWFGGRGASREEGDCWVSCLSSKRTPLPLCLHGYELPRLPAVSSLLPWRASPQTRSRDKSLTLMLVLLVFVTLLKNAEQLGSHKQSLHRMKLIKPPDLSSGL